jgi:hypothetical protein
MLVKWTVGALPVTDSDGWSSPVNANCSVFIAMPTRARRVTMAQCRLA